MKKLFATLLFAAFAFVAQAQVVNIYSGGKVKQYSTSSVDSITFTPEGTQQPLVSFDVQHISPFSFDVDVKKSATCDKYVLGVYRQSQFRPTEFVEAAEQTLQPDAWFRPLKNVWYESAIIPESSLNINSLDTDYGTEFVVAVYAMDDLGGSQKYTKTFNIATEMPEKGAATATITIDEESLAFDHFDYSIQCNHLTQKVITVCTNVAWVQGLTQAKFEGMTDAQRRAFIQKQYQPMPEQYHSAVKGSMNCNAQSTFLIYALPIDEDGNVGKLAYKFITTPKPVMDGKGTVKCQSLTQGDDHEVVNVNLKADANTAYVRLMWLCRTDFANYSSSLPEEFSKAQNANVLWAQYDADALPSELDVLHPGDEYALWAVTIDGRGKLSEPVNLCLEATGAKYFTTKEKPAEPDPEVTLDGEGQIGVDIEEIEVEANATYHLNYTITKGDKTAKAFVIRTGETLEADVKAVVDEHLAGYPTDYNVRHEIDFATSSTYSGNEQSLIAYNPTYGGSFVIFVTLDVNGKFNITHYYTPLQGLKEYKATR